MEIEIGEVIAVRELRAMEVEGPGSLVEIVLGRPHRREDSKDFVVPYMIRGCDTEKYQYAVGIDAFQALQLALGVLDAELVAFQRRFNVKLQWMGAREGDLGFGESHLRVL